MEYRRLGGSGLKVSEISLGSWLTYGDMLNGRMRSNQLKLPLMKALIFLIRLMPMSGELPRSCWVKR